MTTETSSLSGSRRPHRIFQSIGAVLAGIAVVIVLSTVTDIAMHATGVFPPWEQPMTDSLYVLATIYRCVYAIAGGYVAARLAPDRPMRHALVLGVVGLALSIFGVVAAWGIGHQWYGLTLAATAIPCAWAGGKLRESQSHTRTDG